jgi:phenylpropionate dioxygenase-like ring-hydroxylating dioxygenase large terminal subunit
VTPSAELATAAATAAKAATLPASWYADPAHHRTQLAAIFGRGWSCVGLTDDLAPTNGYLATTTPDGTPVLVTTDGDGTLHGFLNVCRHRGAPLADGCGTARALSCPYHSWVYRLDGALARCHGMDGAEGFDPADHSLHRASVATWGRFVFVCPRADAPPLDLGPLAEALNPYAVESFTEVVRDSTERAFNWKVLVENYSENFHTPWVHPELIVRGWDYPIVNEGAVSLAWDRPQHPRNRTEEVLATARPGDPEWGEVARDQIDDVFIAGVYFTVWPNLLVSVFPRYLSAFWLTPTSATTTRVDYLRAWHPSVPAERREADLTASRLVGAQDLDICEAVQRGYTAGVDTMGRLSPEHETGVAHVHDLLRSALAGGAGADDG